MPRRNPICIFKCLYSDINYLPKKLLKSWLKSAKSPLPVDVDRASLAPHLYSRVFSLTWPASMQIYWNKRKRLHKKKVQLPQYLFGTPTRPPFHCFGTPIWPP